MKSLRTLLDLFFRLPEGNAEIDAASADLPQTSDGELTLQLKQSVSRCLIELGQIYEVLCARAAEEAERKKLNGRLAGKSKPDWRLGA